MSNNPAHVADVRKPQGALTFTLICMFLTGCQPTGFKIMPVPVDRSLKERQLMRDPGFVSAKIALIDVDGVLMNAPAQELLSKGEHPVSFLTEKLEAAREDRAVKGVILRINSPGGSVTASEIMYSEIKRFRAGGKPVLAMMMDVAASGGYYIACGCDEIMAHPTSVTGSIGVIMQTFNLEGTLTKLGITTDAIKSGPLKDAGSPLRAMRPDERVVFQEIINAMYMRFVDVVCEGRPQLTRERVLELADGRVYTAQQALEDGLIDRIGSLREAIDRAKAMAGISACRVVTYQRPFAWHPNIYAHAPDELESAQASSLIDLDLPSWLKFGNPRLMYLWTAP